MCLIREVKIKKLLDVLKQRGKDKEALRCV